MPCCRYHRISIPYRTRKVSIFLQALSLLFSQNQISGFSFMIFSIIFPNICCQFVIALNLFLKNIAIKDNDHLITCCIKVIVRIFLLVLCKFYQLLSKREISVFLCLFPKTDIYQRMYIQLFSYVNQTAKIKCLCICPFADEKIFSKRLNLLFLI